MKQATVAAMDIRLASAKLRVGTISFECEVHIHTYIHTYAHIQCNTFSIRSTVTLTYSNTHILTYAQTHLLTYAHTHILTYAHTHPPDTHTHTHTHTHSGAAQRADRVGIGCSGTTET
jgi:hypothetical protein